MSGDIVPAPGALTERMHYAKALAASGLLPDAYRHRPENVLLAIETGYALGLPPTAALNGIAVINGKPTLGADLMATLVRRAGHKLRITQDGMSVTATLIRADDPDFEYRATWDEAKARQAGKWGMKGPWSQYPEQMLRSRAITEVCRQGASDCLFGVVYTPEELDAAPVDAGQATTTPGGAAPAAEPVTATIDDDDDGELDENGEPTAGRDDTVARLREECSRIVLRFVARFGGNAHDLAQEWQAGGGTADPEALTAWLTTKISATERN